MSQDKRIWLEAQNRAVRLVEYINQLSTMALNLPESAKQESFRAVLNRAEKRAHDLQRAIYRLKRDTATDETSASG